MWYNVRDYVRNTCYSSRYKQYNKLFTQGLPASWVVVSLLLTLYIQHCSIAHSIICTRLFRGKMHSDWFNGIEILQGRRQHGEKVGYCYPSGLEKTLCKWDIYTYVPLVTKGLNVIFRRWHTFRPLSYASFEVFHNNVIEESGLWLFRLGTFQNGDNMFVRNVGAYLPSVTYRNVDYWAMPHTWTSHGLHLL